MTLEEEAFFRTLRKGGTLLNQVIEQSKAHGNQISGDDAFKLKDTYGLPIDEILLFAKDQGLSVDMTRYNEQEEAAKERSRGAQKIEGETAKASIFEEFVKKHGRSSFLGYTHEEGSSEVTGLIKEGQFVSSLKEGEKGSVILKETPFYAECGGQVGDKGVLKSEGLLFQVSDCMSPFPGAIVHEGKMGGGVLKVGDRVTSLVDHRRRLKIKNNHTATHLLHWALQKVLGEHIKQAGSVVDDMRLRFDFSHHKALQKEELKTIEELVNDKIRENSPVKWYEIPYDEAIKRSEIKQFFGEKYGTLVRVIDIDFSKELCGGTHTSQTGNIGLFKIVKEGSIAQGVRRIEAVTGEEAENFVFSKDQMIDEIAEVLKTQAPLLKQRVEKLLEENQKLNEDLKALKLQEIQKTAHSLLQEKKEIKETALISSIIQASPQDLRLIGDMLASKLKSFVILLGAKHEEKGHLFFRVSSDLKTFNLSANDLIREAAPLIEGIGGGKDESAQAGGKKPEKLQEALDRAKHLLSQKLSL